METPTAKDVQGRCTCTQTPPPAFTNCGEIRLRHHVVCAANNKEPRPKDIPRIQFNLNTRCPFCLLITQAFLRRLESQGRTDLIKRVREGREYQNFSARFNFENSHRILWGHSDNEQRYVRPSQVRTVALMHHAS
jgi:hypothetical protein